MVDNKKEQKENQNVHKVVKKNNKNQTNDAACYVSTHGWQRQTRNKTVERKRRSNRMMRGGVMVERGLSPSPAEGINMFDLLLPGLIWPHFNQLIWLIAPKQQPGSTHFLQSQAIDFLHFDQSYGRDKELKDPLQCKSSFWCFNVFL